MLEPIPPDVQVCLPLSITVDRNLIVPPGRKSRARAIQDFSLPRLNEENAASKLEPYQKPVAPKLRDALAPEGLRFLYQVVKLFW